MILKKFNQIFISFNKMFFFSVFIYDQKAVSVTKTHYQIIYKPSFRTYSTLFYFSKNPGFQNTVLFFIKNPGFQKTVLFIKNPGFQKTVLFFIKNPGFQKTVLFIKNPGFQKTVLFIKNPGF